MLNNVIKNSRPLTMTQLLRHLDYGRKLRSEQLNSSYKNEIKTLVGKPTSGMNKKSPFEYKGKKFVKTFMTYNVDNKVKKTNYRVTICVLNDKPKPTLNSAIQYYCGCPDFKFRMAYRLRELGVLIETKSTISLLGKAYTDEPKTDTVDSLMCKHCYNVFQNLKKYKKWEF
jgi:hypothetical protein